MVKKANTTQKLKTWIELNCFVFQLSLFFKGKTCATSQGSDANGEHARIWAATSSWRISSEFEDLFQYALTLCLQFSSGGLRSQKFMQLMAGRGEWSVTWKGHMIEYGSHIIGSLSKCSFIGMKALHHHHHHHQENWAQSSRMELSAKSVKTRRVLLPKEEPISGRPPAWGEPPSQSSGPRRPQGPGLCRQG